MNHALFAGITDQEIDSLFAQQWNAVTREYDFVSLRYHASYFAWPLYNRKCDKCAWYAANAIVFDVKLENINARNR